MTLRQLGRLLHLGSRLAGDVDAARRGRLGKRLVRRVATRKTLGRVRW